MLNFVEFIEIKYNRKQIAEHQLERAITLFLTNNDLSSVITLAGAALNILAQLVRNSGKEPFEEYARRVHNYTIGFTPPREKYNHFIHKVLGIIAHKHMNATDLDIVKIDLNKCAIDALTAAVADYETLFGTTNNHVKSFIKWTFENTEKTKIMEYYKNLPKEFRRK